MKFALLVAGTAGFAMLAVFAIPGTVVGSASVGFHHVVERSGFAQVSLADLNPLRAIFDYEKRRIQTPLTPEQLGFHPSPPMTFSPIAIVPPQSLKLDLSQSFGQQAQMQIEQNNRRMQDMQAYARDPTHWVGPPPN